MSTFEIGEIAILQHCYNPSYNGEECEILSRYTGRVNPWDGKPIVVVGGYLVRARDGREGVVEHFQLRKKKPPTREIDTIVKWEDCLWKPKVEQLEGAA